jgi:preflagellin peptidase FlaK
VEQKWIIDALRVVIGIVILAYASVQDVRTRRVQNAAWMVLAAIALVLLPIQLVADGESLTYLLVTIPILAILADIYLDHEEGSRMAKYGPAAKYSIGIIAIVALGYAWGTRPYFQHLLAMPVMMLFIVAMYMSDVIRGGADAKALISLAVLFPVYPALGGFPLLEGNADTAQLFFPFSFVILINAAIMTAIMPIVFLSRNLASRDIKFPQSLLGYRVEHSQLRNKHVWLMERMNGEMHEFFARPKQDENLENEVDLLVRAGHTRLWITPKIPFIVPLLASLVFSAVIGNLIVLLASF